MSQVILDPDDPTTGFIASAAVKPFGQQRGETTLMNIHRAAVCAGRPCVIHRPSQHHMIAWPLNWRDDRGLMERMCTHGCGHPDPDDLAFQLDQGDESAAIHGCDGCCRAT